MEKMRKFEVMFCTREIPLFGENSEKVANIRMVLDGPLEIPVLGTC